MTYKCKNKSQLNLRTTQKQNKIFWVCHMQFYIIAIMSFIHYDVIRDLIDLFPVRNGSKVVIVKTWAGDIYSDYDLFILIYKSKYIIHYFLMVSNRIFTKGHSSRIRGRGDSYCSVSLKFQESCHEFFIILKHMLRLIYVFFFNSLTIFYSPSHYIQI